MSPDFISPVLAVTSLPIVWITGLMIGAGVFMGRKLDLVVDFPDRNPIILKGLADLEEKTPHPA